MKKPHDTWWESIVRSPSMYVTWGIFDPYRAIFDLHLPRLT
jgi:hypothetical protein